MPTLVSGKYFFLSDGWVLGRIWEHSGLWSEVAWRRKPIIQRLDLCILEQGEKLWLYQVEEAVLMVEVKPGDLLASHPAAQSIGQVVLKRLMSAEQVLDRLITAEAVLTAQQQ